MNFLFDSKKRGDYTSFIPRRIPILLCTSGKPGLGKMGGVMRPFCTFIGFRVIQPYYGWIISNFRAGANLIQWKYSFGSCDRISVPVQAQFVSPEIQFRCGTRIFVGAQSKFV
jgi:hypothetical protein